MEDLGLSPDYPTHSRRVKAGIARAKAEGRRWGRPSTAEKRMDPDLSVKVSNMRARGIPWSEVADCLQISESTARRLLQRFQRDCEGRYKYNVKNTLPQRDVSDTCQKNHSDEETSPGDSRRSATAIDSERSEIVKAMTYEQGEFIKAALQLILESQKLTKQVLERIGVQRNVQKHP